MSGAKGTLAEHDLTVPPGLEIPEDDFPWVKCFPIATSWRRAMMEPWKMLAVSRCFLTAETHTRGLTVRREWKLWGAGLHPSLSPPRPGSPLIRNQCHSPSNVRTAGQVLSAQWPSYSIAYLFSLNTKYPFLRVQISMDSPEKLMLYFREVF